MIASISFALNAAIKRSTSTFISARASALDGGESAKLDSVIRIAPATSLTTSDFIDDLRCTIMAHWRGACLRPKLRTLELSPRPTFPAFPRGGARLSAPLSRHSPDDLSFRARICQTSLEGKG